MATDPIKRWKVIISYKPQHMARELHYVEELPELADIIEHGPDWRHIDKITLTLNT